VGHGGRRTGYIAAKKPDDGNDLGTCQIAATLEETSTTQLRLALVLSAVAVLALLSIVGCAQYYGKGKAPPPVVTKG